MATPTWQARPVPPPGGAQQTSGPMAQSYWGAPGTSNNQVQPPRPPYGPPSGPPSGSQPSSYAQSSASQTYRAPNQMTASGASNQPPPPLPPGSSPAMLQSGPYAPIHMQPMPGYGPPMGNFQGSRWQPPVPGSTPTPPSAPGVVRTSTESPLVNQRPSMPPSGPATVVGQPGPPAASAPMTQPPHYQTYPVGPVPQSMGPWMPPPQQTVQMQQRPPYPSFQSSYPVAYANHHAVGLSQDMSAGKAPPQVGGPYNSGGDSSLAPGLGNQPAKMWGHPAPFVGSLSVPFPGKDASVASNGRPAGAESNATQNSAAVSGSDPGSQDLSGKNMKSGPDAWTAHKTADGAVYYYNSVTGKSTYDKPPGFAGEAEKVTSQPTPVSWERLNGTDWALVTTNDGKKYYYNTKSQATSWQVPSEVAELRKKQAEEAASKSSTEVVAAPGTTAEKSIVSFSLNIPAAATGGREAVGHKGLVANSALDLIKKKLQDPGAPTVSSPVPPGSGPTTVISASNLDPSTGKVENTKDRSKGNNVDSVSSDSSSDSDEEDPGPTKEERIAQFKEMLKEKGIAPFSKWEKELPKIIFDVRFKAIPSHTERRAIFEHYVRTRADEERKEKRAAQKAAVEGFKQLLEEAAKDLSYHTTYENFSRNWGQDPRFEALERKDRETLLNERVLPLRKAEDERVKAEHAAAVGAFKAMLLERADINTSSRWSKIREIVRNDPRYSAVKREEREGLFNAYISELLSAEQEAERAAKAKREEEEKIKEREREMRKRKEREEQEMDRVRAKARRKDAVTSYQALLTEKIKDPEASWTEARPKLEKDPLGRATNSELDLADCEKLFREHVNEIFDRCVREYRLLLADMITIEAAQKLAEEDKHILTSWSDAKKLLKPDPRYGKMPRRDRESWWRRYAEDVQRRMKAAAPTASKDDKAAPANGAKGLASESSLRSPGLRRNTSRR